MMATNSPFCTENDTLSSALTAVSPLPYTLDKCSTRRISMIASHWDIRRRRTLPDYCGAVPVMLSVYGGGVTGR